MLSDPIIIILLFVIIAAYLIPFAIFFKKKNRKDLFIRAYFITGGVVGILYILLNIFIPQISAPIVPYMKMLNYSDNAYNTAEEIKTLLTDKEKKQNILGIINDKNTDEVKKIEHLKKELDNLLDVPLRNIEYHNNKNTMNMLDDIFKYYGIEYISKVVENTEKENIQKLLNEIHSVRKKVKIVKSINKQLGLIDSNLSELIKHKENNLESVEDIKCEQLFNTHEGTIDKIFEEQSNILLKEMKEIKKNINSSKIVYSSDINTIQRVLQNKNSVKALETLEKDLTDVKDEIDDRISQYNEQRDKELQTLFKKKLINKISKNNEFVYLVAYMIKSLQFDVDAIFKRDNFRTVRNSSDTYLATIPFSLKIEFERDDENKKIIANINYIIYSDYYKIDKEFNEKIDITDSEVDEIITNVRPELNINIDNINSEKLKDKIKNKDIQHIIFPYIENISTLIKLKVGLTELETFIKRSPYIHKVFTKEQSNINTVKEGIEIIKKIYNYNNTESLILYLKDYSSKPIQDFKNIKQIINSDKKENNLKDTIRDIINQYRDKEFELSGEINYDMDEIQYSSMNKQLKLKYKNAISESAKKLGGMLENDKKNLELFEEALITIDIEKRNKLVEKWKKDDKILADNVEYELAFYPAFPFIEREDLSKINDQLKNNIIKDIEKFISSKQPNFPKKGLLLLSPDFRNEIYNTAIDSIKTKDQKLIEIDELTPENNFIDFYKEKLSENSELDMPDELKIEIIISLNEIISIEMDDKIKQLQKTLEGNLSLDLLNRKNAKDTISDVNLILSDDNLKFASNRITAMKNKKPLLYQTQPLQKDSVLITQKIEDFSKNDNYIPFRVIESYNIFSVNPFNTVVGFILSVLLWPLFSILLLTGGILTAHSTFLFYQPALIVLIVIIGLITLIMPYILTILSKTKKTDI